MSAGQSFGGRHPAAPLVRALEPFVARAAFAVATLLFALIALNFWRWAAHWAAHWIAS